MKTLCLPVWKLAFCCLLLLPGRIFAQYPLGEPDALAKVKPPTPPDTLLIGEYRILVEKYELVGPYIKPTRTFQKVSGYGRINFDCRHFPVFPPFGGFGNLNWGDLKIPLSPFKFKIVEKVVNPDREIALQDARILDPKIKTGADLTLSLPLVPNANAPAISGRIAELIGAFKPGQPTGIRVQFDVVEIQLDAAHPTFGHILTGKAYYPAHDAIPTPPFTLDIEGFTLEVKALEIFPAKPAVALARLLLPTSISSGQDCSRAALNLGAINLTPHCEFYKDLPAENYGPFGIANTTLVVSGKGYTADFSSTVGTAPGGGPKSWKGVILQTGQSDAAPSGTIYSNTGYLQAGYQYAQATVTKTGFSATLNNGTGYSFFPVHPFGYGIQFSQAQLQIMNNQVSTGTLAKNIVALPKEAVRDRTGATIQIQVNQIDITGAMDMQAVINDDNFPKREFFWGDFTHPGKEIMAYGVSNCYRAALYFQGFNPQNYYPVVGDNFTGRANFNWTVDSLKAFGMTGLTVSSISNLFVQSPDVPGPSAPFFPLGPNFMSFLLKSRFPGWFNVQTQGVHAGLYSDGIINTYKLGDPASPYYVGGIPFIFGKSANDKHPVHTSIVLQFVESAVFKSDVRGGVTLPQPAGSELQVNKLDFTSTAQIAGGEVDLSTPASLDYWGLQLVPRPGFTSSGVLSVKSGQIILTAAGLAENRHFKEPFYLTWGEMLANGSLGRLFFDYHTAGQQFDAFNYSPQTVQLSPFMASVPNGFLRVGGTVHFPFFGSDYMHIIDQYDPTKPTIPYNNRVIFLSDTASAPGFLPTDFTLFGNWSDGLGIFDIQKIAYNDASQNGFNGTGTSSIGVLPGGVLMSALNLQNGDGCISLIPGADIRSVNFAPFSDVTVITKIWGCICLMDDGISNITFGGSLTTSSNTLMVGVRAGQNMAAIVHITPSTYEMTLDGEATLSVALSLDLEVSGHLNVKIDVGNAFMEGEVDGYFRTASGAVLAGGSFAGEGQANWHVGFNPLDGNSYQSFQGTIAMNIMGVAVSIDVVPPFVHSTGAGTGLNAGFYLGVNAPKSEAWILLGPDPRYQLNMAALPDQLTGVYGFVSVKQAIDLFVVSGEYEVFVGLGAFVLDVVRAANLGGLQPPGFPVLGTPYAIGNLGGRIHGEILGGAVGAGAWFNLQLILPYPFSFQGTVGLEGCVAWVFCGSVSITVGLNTAQGFYIR